MSDLHLEFRHLHVEKLPNEKDMVLVLAGDIFPVDGLTRSSFDKDYQQFRRVFDFYAEMCERHRHVVYVFGNHEFYGGNFHREHKAFAQLVSHPNLTVLEQNDLVLDDVAFVGATLFTDFNKADPIVIFDAKRRMNDYNCVEQDDHLVDGEVVVPAGKLMPETILEYHRQARSNIMRISRSHKDLGRRVVMVTHHAPSHMSLDARYRTGYRSELNGCYVNQMDLEVMDSGANVYVHGHTHSSHAYTLGDCRVYCNPRGYCDENPKFSDQYVVEV